jgi:hypothetical protein
MNRLTIAIESRKKLIAALAGVIVAVLGDRAGVSGDALTLAVITIVSYITGTAIEDGLRGRN